MAHPLLIQTRMLKKLILTTLTFCLFAACQGPATHFESSGTTTVVSAGENKTTTTTTTTTEATTETVTTTGTTVETTAATTTQTTTAQNTENSTDTAATNTTNTSATVDTSTLTKTGSVTLSKIQDFKINQLTGLTENGNNALKLQDSCIAGDTLVAVGIMTPTVAIHQNGVLQIINTDLNGEFSYKHLYCGGTTAFVVTETQIARINLTTLETAIIDRSDDAEQIYYLAGTYDDASHRLFIQYLGDPGRILVYDSNSLELMATLSLSRSDIHILSNGDFLAVNTAGNRSVTTYDGKTYKVKSTITLSSSPTTTAYDVMNNNLWWFSSGRQTANYVNLASPSIVKTVSGIVPDAAAIQYTSGYIAILCINCYDTGGNGDKRGGITVIDANSKTKLYDLELLYRHDTIAVDTTQTTVSLANNDNMSVTKVSLTERTSEVIEMGNGTEWFAIDSQSHVHLVDRLGGDTIYSLDPDTGIITQVPTHTWSLGAIYIPDKNQIMTFNHLGDAFSFYDVNSTQAALSVNAIWDLHDVLDEPEHDALGDIAYDQKRHIAYAAVPEYNKLVIAKSDSAVTVIDLPDYSDIVSYDELKGAGRITLALDETNNLLFVHIKEISTIFVYDGNQNYALTTSFALQNTGGDITYPIAVLGSRLYAGRDVYSLPNLAQVGRLQYGQRAFALDEDFQIVFTYGLDTTTGTQTVYAVNATTQEKLGEITLETIGDTEASLEYDSARGLIYSLDMEAAILTQINVFH